MEYSSVTIDFAAMPADGQEINIFEASLGLNINQIFRTLRDASGEVKIPDSFQGRYGLDVNAGTSVSNIGVAYKPVGSSTFIQLALESVAVMDNANGTFTYIVYSEEQPMLYDLRNGQFISWVDGGFLAIGGGTGTYAGTVSENYKNAFELDFNTTGIFTVVNTNGAAGSGLGLVNITANYPNANFATLLNTANANIFIDNVITVVGFSFSPSLLQFNHKKNEPLPSLFITMTGDLWKVVGKPNFIFSSTTPGVVITTVVDGSGAYQVVEGSGNAIIAVKLTVYYDVSTTFLFSDLAGSFAVLENNLPFGEIDFTVSVARLSDWLSIPYITGQKSFTLDNKFFEFRSVNQSTYFQFDATIKTYDFITNAVNVFFISLKILLFKGYAKENLGQVIHRLMRKFVTVNDSLLQYKEATLKIKCTEIVIADETIVRSGTSAEIPFIAGISRGITTVGFLDFNPAPNRVTKNGFAYLNILIPTGSYELRTFKNGNLVTAVALPASTGIVLCKKVLFLNFEKGDVIEYVVDIVGEINALAPKKTFILFPDNNYSNIIVWENEFLLQSAIECTGSASIIPEGEFQSQTVYVDFVERLEHLSSSKSVRLNINTGWLLYTDIDTVESLMRSKRAWLIQENSTIELRPINKKLPIKDLEEELIQFSLEFKINQTNNEETYSL